MIILNNLKGEIFALNCNLIETISESPDTIILLTNGKIHRSEERRVGKEC